MDPNTHHRLVARSRHWLHFERLELRTLLSANFSDPHVIMQPELDGPELVFAVDLDGDEDLDLLAATRYDNRVVCYENMDGAGTFGPQRTISSMSVGTRSPIARDAERTAYPADLDGDGDVDVLHAIRGETMEDDKIVWYENVDGAGSFGPPKLITTRVRTAVHAADLDGDGDVDVLAFSNEDDKIAWHENMDGDGTFGPERVVTTSLDRVHSLLTADLDGDRDLDVLSFSWTRNTIVWFENTDGKGNFGRYDITTNADHVRSAIAADIDQDGDLDVLATEDEGVSLYENTDGAGNFGPQRLIIEYAQTLSPWFIRAADMDHDGDLDVLLAGGGDGEIALYENLSREGMFGGKRVITQEGSLGNSLVDAADVDTDGDLDVVFASVWRDKIAWHQNIDGAGTFGPQKRVGSGVSSPGATTISDLDGDGDLDVIYKHVDTIVWQENTDGLGTYGPQSVIADALDVRDLHTADLDGDGDLDLVSSSSTIAWYENTDGLGAFGPRHVIAQRGSVAGITTGDLDGDGDLDVLAGLVWYENINGAGSYGTGNVIDTRESFWDLSAADLDGDGDLDVLGIANDGKRWYENIDGSGTFGPKRMITDSRWEVIAADLDGDGDLDVLTSDTGIVAWFENEDGAGSFGPRRVISQDDSNRGPAIAAADLDNDGDLDVILASREDSTNIIGFYENTDGAATFGPQLVIREYSDSVVRAVFARDVDTDGDLDVVTRSEDGIVWYENLLAHAGDANRDGQFNSSDLVQVFQAGEYEDDVDGNSTWEEGDWNGDGDFDSGDLVEAFQKGLYERKSRGVAAKIAAAVDWFFADDEHFEVFVA